MKKEIIILIGSGCAGKTTYAKKIEKEQLTLRRLRKKDMNTLELIKIIIILENQSILIFLIL